MQLTDVDREIWESEFGDSSGYWWSGWGSEFSGSPRVWGLWESEFDDSSRF